MSFPAGQPSLNAIPLIVSQSPVRAERMAVPGERYRLPECQPKEVLGQLWLQTAEGELRVPPD